MSVKAELKAGTSLTDLVKAGLPQAGVSAPVPTIASVASATVAAKKKADDKKEDENCEDDTDDESAKDEDEEEDAEGDEDDESAEDDEDDEKARAYAEFDDRRIERKDSDAGDRADNADEVTYAARLRERSRIAAILDSEAGQANPRAARALAFGSSNPRNEVIAMISAMGPAQETQTTSRAQLHDRMSTQVIPDVGASDTRVPANDASSLANAIIMAGKKRRGEV